ncbi:MAG: biopolymer transporter ExbD [Phycisphaeraceae bacterium]|nr:MAG: biopolymer transporter ExbD [Phycisphaeraceae bacterium]
MRRRRVGIPDGGGAGKINVTPLIDVVMVLIVFYLIVGRLATDQGRRVVPPATAVGDASAQGGVVIHAARAGDGSAEYRVGSEVVPASSLASVIRGVSPGGSVPVSVRADRALTYAEVAPALEACREAGLTGVRLVAQRESGGGVGSGRGVEGAR